MVVSWEDSIHNWVKKIKNVSDLFTQRAVFALITTENEDGRYYLLQWNPKWQCYNFIGGKVDNQLGDNNHAQAIRRELNEEIGIGDIGGVFEEQEVQQIKMVQYSQRDKKLKLYQFSIFIIYFFPNLAVDRRKTKRALRWLSTKHDNIYVSTAEIKNLKTTCGKPISRTVRRILRVMREI